MGWKIKTLDSAAFAAESRTLERIVADSGYKPDCVLAIASGGVHVAANMFAGVAHMSVTLRRSSSSAKGGLIKKIIKRLPRKINDWLRIVEAQVLSARRQSPSNAVLMLPPIGRFRRILIVDDAVDSGITLQAVTKAVTDSCPDSAVRSAVITMTTDTPALVPDYAIYRDNTLIRFPWSLDS